MAGKIIWSLLAQKDRKNILEYWVERNNSKRYSKKLNELFKASIKLISIYPEIGRKTDFPNIRRKVVKDYEIFYEVTTETINILRIWDDRQEPKRLKLKQ